MAQPFDLRNLTLEGEPRPVADHIEHGTQEPIPGRQLLRLSQRRAGVASRHPIFPVFTAMVRSQRQETRCRWRARGLLEPRSLTGRYQTGRRHPRSADKDARHLDLRSVARHEDPADLRSRRRSGSIWSPDGTRIAFTSNRLGQRDIYQKPADGSGSEELLLGGKGGQKNVEDWSPDGKYLIYNTQTRCLRPSLCAASRRRPEARAVPEYGIHYPAGSILSEWPLGRLSLVWNPEDGGLCAGIHAGLVAAARQMAGLHSGRGTPRWRRDGKELFYHFGDGFFAVDVKTDGASFEAGIPRPLFEAPYRKSQRVTAAPRLWSPGTASGSWSSQQIEKTANEPLEVLVNWR